MTQPVLITNWRHCQKSWVGSLLLATEQRMHSSWPTVTVVKWGESTRGRLLLWKHVRGLNYFSNIITNLAVRSADRHLTCSALLFRGEKVIPEKINILFLLNTPWLTWISKKITVGYFCTRIFLSYLLPLCPCGLLEVEWPTSLHVPHNYLAGL